MAHLDHVWSAHADDAVIRRSHVGVVASVAHLIRGTALSVVLLFTHGSVHAQVVDVPATQVDVGSGDMGNAAPATDANSDALTTTTLRDAPTSATRISTARFIGRGMSLGDVLETTAGLQLRRFGGIGAPTMLSIRGMGGNHVAFVLDDQPILSATQGPLNLSTLPLPLLESIEIYRGAGPSRFQSPMGGVVRMISHAPRDRLKITSGAGYGSQNTRNAHLLIGGPLSASIATSAFASYQGSDGNFTYYDDRGTYYNPSDDRLQQRRNNAFNNAVVRWLLQGDGPRQSTWQFSTMGTWHSQGIPGPGAQQTAHTHAQEVFGTARLALKDATFLNGRIMLSHGIDVQHNRRAFRDPDLEAGLTIGTSSHAQLTHAGMDSRVQWLPTLNHATEWAPRIEWTGYDQTGARDSPSTRAQAMHQQRWQLGMGLEHRWEIVPRLVIAPVLRFDGIWDVGPRSSLGSTSPTHYAQQQVSPRASMVYRTGACRIRASGGRYHRFASLLERFGDASITIPNPTLAPEHGWSGDGGADCAWHLRFARDQKYTWVPHTMRIGFDVAGFGTRAQDLIVLVQTAQQTLQAQNLGTNTIAGVESRVDLQFNPWLTGQIAYTFTHARGRSGTLGESDKQTPGIPAHRVDATVWFGPALARLGYGIDAMTQAYLDRANLQPIPTRVLHHLYADFTIPQLNLTVRSSLRNVGNARSTRVTLPGSQGPQAMPRALNDFMGYPLAGRTWFVSLIWNMP